MVSFNLSKLSKSIVDWLYNNKIQEKNDAKEANNDTVRIGVVVDSVADGEVAYGGVHISICIISIDCDIVRALREDGES